MADPNQHQQAAFGPQLDEWTRIVDHLTHSDIDAHRKLGHRVHDCCRWPALYKAEDSTILVPCESRCRSRVCPRCGRSRARAAIARLSDLVDVMDSPRFLTLTLASSDDHLATQLRHLTQSFQVLRRSVPWQTHVKGGVYTMEITLNARTGRWHPHLHALIDGTYFRHDILKEAWSKASNGSQIVDIRACHGRTNAARYMAEYVGKSAAAEHVPEDRLDEWVEGTKGVRWIQTWGTLHGIKLDDDEEIERPKLQRVTSLIRLAEAAANGQQEARDLWDRLHDRTLQMPYSGVGKGLEARKVVINDLTNAVTRWLNDNGPPELRTGEPTQAEPGRAKSHAADAWLFDASPPPMAGWAQ